MRFLLAPHEAPAAPPPGGEPDHPHSRIVFSRIYAGAPETFSNHCL